MNKDLQLWMEMHGMEVVKRRIYAETYFAITGKRITVDEEALGVPYKPKESDGKEMIEVIQSLLWGTYTSKEFYKRSSRPRFIESFSSKAVAEYKKRYKNDVDTKKPFVEDKESTLDYRLEFGSDGLIPVVTQDRKTKEVLIFSVANRQAVEMTLETGIATYWSRSREELWVKGKTSGDFLKVDEVRINCEQNSLVYLVTPQGKGACHTKDADGNARASCYYRRIEGTPATGLALKLI